MQLHYASNDGFLISLWKLGSLSLNLKVVYSFTLELDVAFTINTYYGIFKFIQTTAYSGDFFHGSVKRHAHSNC